MHAAKLAGDGHQLTLDDALRAREANISTAHAAFSRFVESFADEDDDSEGFAYAGGWE